MNELTGIFGSFIILLLLTSFVKLFTTFSLLRYGVGLEGGSFGIVIFALSLALTVLVMNSQLADFGGFDSFMRVGQAPDSGALEKKFSPFLERYTDPDMKARMGEMSQRLRARTAGVSDQKMLPPKTPINSEPAGGASFSVQIAAFMLSELKQAFYLGLVLLIPFLVIDLLIGNVFMALGVSQIPVAVASLPVKLLLFVSVDGWSLITQKILGTYL